MLKQLTVTIIILLLSTLSLFAEDSGDSGDFEDKDTGNKFVGNNSKLQKLIEHKLVKGPYERCKKEFKDDPEKIGNCIWKDPALQGKQQEISDWFYSESKSDKENRKYERVDTKTLKKTQSPAVKRLQEYFGKKLAETLGTAGPDKGKQVSDHEVFNDIMRSQIGKDIVQAISSYCLDADSKKNYGIANNIEKQRKANIKALGDFKGKKNDAYGDWSACLFAMNNICHKPEEHFKEDDGDNNKKNDVDIDRKTFDFDESKKRSCAILSFIKDMKQNLIYLSDVKKRLAKIKDENSSGIQLAGDSVDKELQAPTIYIGSAQDGKKNIDQLTTMTSNEYMSQDNAGLEDQNKKDIKELEKCKENLESESCKKLFYSDKDAETAKNELMEYKLRTDILANKIDNMKADKKSLAIYLKEQGYTEDQINMLIDETSTAKDIKDAIKLHYDEERKNTIEMLNAKLGERTIKKDESRAEKIKKIDIIIKNQQKKVNSQADLIFYNNVVTGFLKLGQGKEQKINSNTLFQELADSAYSKSDEKKAALELISKNIQEKGGLNKDEPVSVDETGLDIDSINNIITNYTKEQRDKALNKQSELNLIGGTKDNPGKKDPKADAEKEDEKDSKD